MARCLNHTPRFSRGSLRILFLQSRLNLPRKSPEVCDALQFIVRQLDMKMMLQPGEQFESLQAVNAERYRLDMTPYPTIARIVGRCMKLGPFQAAHPDNQPDAER